MEPMCGGVPSAVQMGGRRFGFMARLGDGPDSVGVLDRCVGVEGWDRGGWVVQLTA